MMEPITELSVSIPCSNACLHACSEPLVANLQNLLQKKSNYGLKFYFRVTLFHYTFILLLVLIGYFKAIE